MEKVIIKKSYQSNDYCKSINCEELTKRVSNEANACSTCQAYLFHQYLKESNYSIVEVANGLICVCNVCTKLNSN